VPTYGRLFAAAAVVAFVGTHALADQPQDGNPNSPGLGWAHGKGVPGPVAGAGLSYVLLAGGYAVFRWYRRRRKPE